METKTILSEKFSLQTRDFVKSLTMAVLTAVLTFVYELIQQGGFEDVNYKTVAKVAASAAIGYILKNWLLEPAKVITIADSNNTAVVAKSMISDQFKK